MTVIEEIAAERKRQREEEGWTTFHDDEHNAGGKLAKAASIYADYASDDELHRKGLDCAKARYAPFKWPWGAEWWKPKTRRRDLIRAAALIVAEIERLDRANKREGEGEGDG